MKRLLIIDDEPGIVQEVKEFFEEEGFEVHICDTGKGGMALVRKVRPDVLIVDMKLPDASGLDVLKLCKEVSPRTKVIVITGYVDQHLIDEADRLGRDAFMQKPFGLLKLKEEVERLAAG